MKDLIRNLLTDFVLILGILVAAGLIGLVAIITGTIFSLIFGGEIWVWALALGTVDAVLLAVLVRQMMKEIEVFERDSEDHRTLMN